MSEFYPLLTRRAKYVGTPKVYGYGRFRAEISEDCQYRCVYCDTHQTDIGGSPTMELDHLRPESKFARLADDPSNLVYSCRSCNRLKRDDWPAGEHECCWVDKEGYVHPFENDRRKFFRLGRGGEVETLQAPAAYVARRLGLNRPLLKRLRLRALLVIEAKAQLAIVIAQIEARLNASPASPDAETLKFCLATLRNQILLLDFFTARKGID
ncbi:MAG: HNH endonuclease [Opitutae bacterium]|nr:HNH endonuclease [Opitutae bacterium]